MLGISMADVDKSSTRIAANVYIYIYNIRMFCRRTPPVDRWGKSHYIYGIFISIYQFISIDRISIYQYFISFISMYQYIKFPWSIDIYRLSTILDWPTGPGPTSSCPSMTARCKAVTPLGPLPRGSARAVTRAWPRVDGDVPTGKWNTSSTLWI